MDFGNDDIQRSIIEVTIELEKGVPEQALAVASAYYGELVPRSGAHRLAYLLTPVVEHCLREAERSEQLVNGSVPGEAFHARALTEIWRQVITLLATFPHTVDAEEIRR